MGCLPPNITSKFHNVNKAPRSELNIKAMLVMMNAYPNFEE